MRIAVVPIIRDHPWGAPGHCMGALVESLLGAGHEVLWFVAPIDWENPAVQRLEHLGAIVQPLPDGDFPTFVRLGRLRRSIWELSRGGRELKSQLREFRPDHIFLNQAGTWCGLGAEVFEVLAEYPDRYSLICHLNQAAAPFVGSGLDRARSVMRRARTVFFNSSWTWRLAERQIAESIPNAATFQYPVRFAFGEPLAWPENRVPRLAMDNRLDTHQKGIDLALEAIAGLKAEGIETRLSIFGSGPERDFLGDLVRFLGIDGVVSFEGYSEDLESVWSEHEMMLLPSRYEGLGVAMIEAMGFGRPVLRTPLGGSEEWIRDGDTGFLCPGAETDLLLETLRRALLQRRDWPEMGRRANRLVRESLDPDPARVFLSALDAR